MMRRKLKNLKNIRETEWAYLAGIVDGEGTINITGRRYPCIRLKVGNTSYLLLDWLHSLFGGNIHPMRTRSKTKHKQAWIWVVNALQCAQVLEGCLPYLICKEKQAKLVLEYQKTKRYQFSSTGVPPRI